MGEIQSKNGFEKKISGCLTVRKGEGHGLVPAVGQRSVPPPVHLLHSIVFALIAFGGLVAGADADDAVHQPTLGLLLLQVVVVRDAVDQVADLVRLARERQVGRAFGQLLDLVQFIKFKKLFGDERVDVRAAVVQVVQIQVLPGDAGVADGPLAVFLRRRPGPARGRVRGHRVLHPLAGDVDVAVPEAARAGQLPRLAVLHARAARGVGQGRAVGLPWLALGFGRVIRGALVGRQAGLAGAVEAAGEDAAQQGFTAAPAERRARAAGLGIDLRRVR